MHFSVIASTRVGLSVRVTFTFLFYSFLSLCDIHSFFLTFFFFTFFSSCSSFPWVGTKNGLYCGPDPDSDLGNGVSGVDVVMEVSSLKLFFFFLARKVNHSCTLLHVQLFSLEAFFFFFFLSLFFSLPFGVGETRGKHTESSSTVYMEYVARESWCRNCRKNWTHEVVVRLPHQKQNIFLNFFYTICPLFFLFSFSCPHVMDLFFLLLLGFFFFFFFSDRTSLSLSLFLSFLFSLGQVLREWFWESMFQSRGSHGGWCVLFFYFLFFYFLFFIDHSTFVHPFELCLPCVVSVSSPPFSPPFKQVNHLQRVLMESWWHMHWIPWRWQSAWRIRGWVRKEKILSTNFQIHCSSKKSVMRKITGCWNFQKQSSMVLFSVDKQAMVQRWN